MKAIARVLVTATTLAVLGMLATTAAAAASPLVDGPQLGASARATVPQSGHQAGPTCNSGHGAQVDCARSDAPAGATPVPADTTSTAASRVIVLALASIVLVALVAAVTWLSRRHRRLGEAV
ncbi:MAG TPA: hypothetical protein VF486_10635 [Actinomycetes bacterium]